MDRLEPNDSFWIVTLKLETVDDKGKPKKVTEKHLVDGPDLKSVEDKVMQEMNDTICDFEITSSVKSNISVVY